MNRAKATNRLRMPRGRAVVASLAVGAVLLSVSGCQGAFDLPLPGGAANRGDIFRVTAEFADVLDLVPQSSVKVDQVTVGSVEKIELNGWTARVTLRLPKNVKLPDNAVAELKQTSLLGEKYVQLSAPTAAVPGGHSAMATTSPLAGNGRNPEVEEVLSALSLLLNGGGVAQAQDHRDRAQQRQSGATSPRSRTSSSSRHLHRRAGRPEVRDRPRHRQPRQARGKLSPRRTTSPRRWRHCPAASRCWPTSASSWCRCCRP